MQAMFDVLISIIMFTAQFCSATKTSISIKTTWHI